MEIAHESVTTSKGGVDMIDYREILRLSSLGYSRRRISSMVGSSHHTVDQTSSEELNPEGWMDLSNDE